MKAETFIVYSIWLKFLLSKPLPRVLHCRFRMHHLYVIVLSLVGFTQARNKIYVDTLTAASVVRYLYDNAWSSEIA